MEPGDIGKVTEPRSLGFLQNEKLASSSTSHTITCIQITWGFQMQVLGRDLGLCMSRVMLAPGPLFEQQGTKRCLQWTSAASACPASKD